MKKYELVSITVEEKIASDNSSVQDFSYPLYRVRALKYFRAGANGGQNAPVEVFPGQLGGFVSSEKNLSQRGDCWIADSAFAIGDSVVTDNAYLGGKAVISGGALLGEDAYVTGSASVLWGATVAGKANLTDRARLCGKTIVRGYATVRDDAVCGGESIVQGHALVEGLAAVLGSSLIEGEVHISGRLLFGDKAVIKDMGDFIELGPASKSGRTLSAYKTSSGICFTVGCFNGSKRLLLAKIEHTHGDSDTAKRYRKLVEYAEDYLTFNRS